MLRPTDQLLRITCERLEAALALGARETWIDRAELRLPEPSPLGRWLCVLETPWAPLPVAGSSGPDPNHSVEHAALTVLARFEELASLVA